MSSVEKSTQIFSGFSPVNIPGCSLWLDAADRNTLTLSGSNLIQWRDKSGNGYSGTAVASPTVVQSAINGLSVVQFNGTSQYVNFGNVVNMGTSQIYIFAVCKFDTTANGSIVAKSSATSLAGRWFLIRSSGDGGVLTGFDPNGINGVNAAFASTSTDVQLLMGGWNRSTVSIFQNGTQQNTAALASTTSLSSTNPLWIGAYPNSTATAPQAGLFLNGKVGEVLVYLSDLTSSQRQQIEGYLAHKWGLVGTFPATQPYKSIKPVTRAFQPIDISGCSLWLDAADATTMTLTGSNVTTWSDKSSNAFHLTGTNNPIYSTTINGLKTVTTNGSTNYLQNTSLVLAQPFSFFCVVRNRAANVAGFQLVLQGNTSTTAVILYTTATSSVLTQWAGGPSAVTNPTIPITLNITRLYSAIFNSSSSSLGMDGVITSGLNPGANSLSAFRLGIEWSSAIYQDADHCEYLLFNRVVSAAERQQVEGYLANKWGTKSSLPISHPYGPTISAVSSPLSISGCSLWLDAADVTTLTLSGSNVSQWNDKSGLGNNASGGVSPTYSSNGVVFNGTTQYLTTAYSSSFQNETMFFVATLTAAASGGRTLIGASGNGGRQLFTFNTTFAVNKQFVQGGPAGGTVTQNAVTLFGYTSTSGASNTVNLFLNGTSAASGTLATYTTSLTSWIGRWPGSTTEGWVGPIYEIIGFSSTLTTLQRQQIETYLANKWAIPISLNQGGSKMYRPVTVPFNPLQISGLNLWLDAADATTLTLSGTSVSQWNDKSGNARHATQATSTRRPILTSNQINGLPAIKWDGVDDNLAGTITYTLQSTVFLVYNPTVINVDGRLFDTGGNGSGNVGVHWAYGLPQTADIGLWLGGATYPTDAIYTQATASIGIKLASVIFNGTSSLIWRNGNSMPTFGSGVNVTPTGTTYTLGNVSGGGNAGMYNGYVAEVLYYSRNLSTYERQQVEGYLSRKWGLQGNLPTTHPYKKISA